MKSSDPNLSRTLLFVLALPFFTGEAIHAQLNTTNNAPNEVLQGLSMDGGRPTSMRVTNAGLSQLSLGAHHGLSQRVNYKRDPALALGGLSLQFPSVDVGADLDMALDMVSDLSVDMDQLLQQRFFSPAPADPLLGLGLFYLDAESIVGQVLVSDNADESTSNRKGGAISILQLRGLGGGVEIGRFGFNVEGDLVILPFEGKMGLDGFGIDDDIYGIILGIDAASDVNDSSTSASSTANSWASVLTDFGAGVHYSFDLGSWTVRLRDTFSVSGYEIEEDYRNEWLEDALWDSLSDSSYYNTIDRSFAFYYPERRFGAVDELGEYSFGKEGDTSNSQKTGFSREDNSDNNRDDNNRDDNNRDDDRDDDDNTDDDQRDIMARNDYSMTFIQSESYPWQPAFTYRKSNEWYWYSNSDEEEDKPSWDESYTMSLRSVSDDARFHPYWYYTAFHDSDEESFDHTTRLGMAGPLSHYTTFNGNVGLSLDADGERDWLYQFGLRNRPRPRTSQSLQVLRYFTEEDRELTDEVRYILSQSLGPRLSASFITDWSDTVATPEGGIDEDEETLGLGLGLSFRSTSGKFSLRLRGMLDQDRANEDDTQEGDEWRFILNAQYMIFQRTQDSLRLVYRYEWEDNRATDERDWESRFDVRYQYTFKREMLRTRMAFNYRFRWQESGEGDDDFWENLVLFTWQLPLR